MTDLIIQLDDFMKDSRIDWSLCGGYAIELFVGRATRKHKDLDISVYWDDSDNIINYFFERNWIIKAPTKAGFKNITSHNFEEYKFNNLWCINPEYPLDYIETSIEGDDINYNFINRNQVYLDFIEVLFNLRKDNVLLYRRNPKIIRALDKAVLNVDGISILAPEIVLLYKSKYLNEDSELDFRMCLESFTWEQKEWLKSALIMEYGKGHHWLEYLVSN